MPEAQHTPESTEPASDQPVSQKVTTERRIDPSIIRDPLRRLRAKARLLLVVQRIALIGATLLAGLALFTLIDFVLRFPTALRATVLIIAIGVLFWFVRTRIRPAFRFAPRLTDLALRVEQRYPSMQGRLASALEFADWTPESGSKASAMVYRARSCPVNSFFEK